LTKTILQIRLVDRNVVPGSTRMLIQGENTFPTNHP